MSVNFNPLAQAALFQQFGLIGPLRHGLVDRVYHLFQPLIFIAEDVKRTFSPPEKTLLDLTIDAYVQSNRIEEDFDKVKPDLLLAFPQAKRWQIEQFKMIFQTLSDEKLNTFLTELFKQEAEGSIALLIDRLTKVLSLEKVESAIRHVFPLFEARQAVLDISGLTEHDLKLKSAKVRDSLIGIALLHLKEGTDQMAEHILRIFHLNRSPRDHYRDHHMDKSYQLQNNYYILQQNMTLLGTWFLGLSSLLGSKWKAVVATTLLGTFGAAFLISYLKWFKTVPDEFLGYHNLVSDVIKGKIPPVYGREAEVQEIIDQLKANQNNTRVHPIVLGKTGVGKTALINALAWRLARGVDGLPPKLFVIPASDLVSNQPYENKIELITMHLEGEQPIIFIDEFHTACIEKGPSSEKFKPLSNLTH